MSKWKKENAKEHSIYSREWSKTETGIKYREKHKEYARQWRLKNKDKFHAKQKENYAKIKLEVFNYYKKGTRINCACCGEENIAFLTIDHINGDGSEHRRKIDPHGKIGGNGFYYWLKKNNWPDGFQVLCANCNFGKKQNKICPHHNLTSNILDHYQI